MKNILIIGSILLLLGACTACVLGKDTSEKWTPMVVINKDSMKYDPYEGVLSFKMGLNWRNETYWTWTADDYDHPYPFSGSGIAVNDITVKIIAYNGPYWPNADWTNASQTLIKLAAIDDDTVVSIKTMKQTKSFEFIIPMSYRITTHQYDVNTTSSDSISQWTVWENFPDIAPGQHFERATKLIYYNGYSNPEFYTVAANNTNV